jgi:hypothetical protein
MQASSVATSVDLVEAAKQRAEKARFIRKINGLIGHPIPEEWKEGQEFVIGDKNVSLGSGVSIHTCSCMRFLEFENRMAFNSSC